MEMAEEWISEMEDQIENLPEAAGMDKKTTDKRQEKSSKLCGQK